MATAAGLLSDFKSLTEQAISAADEFSQIYYKLYDTQRHRLIQLYNDRSTVVWNGNAVNGTQAINEFFINLPATEHQIFSMDSQPINKIATQGQTAILVTFDGQVKFENERDYQYFTQTLLLMSVNNTWKIINDCLRFIDS
ncbi:NTF2-related export protein 2-like [Clytia hemisphaerica]|uniref:NTF2-related export protein n=1 Tax=Clytia hemisphaerica TaxID=252671 RepID=A0A7M5X990_9CNID|eukprot:TCONS_00053515-protein